MTKLALRSKRNTWTAEQDAYLNQYLIDLDRDFDLTAHHLSERFGERVTPLDCVSRLLNILFFKLYNPPHTESYTELLGHYPKDVHGLNECQMKFTWKSSDIDLDFFEIIVMVKDEPNRLNKLVERIQSRYPQFAWLTPRSCYNRNKDLAHVFNDQGTARYKISQRDRAIKLRIQQEVKHNNIICWGGAIDTLILDLAAKHSLGSDEAKWTQALSHRKDIDAKQCAGRSLILDLMRRHFDSHPTRDATLLHEARLAYSTLDAGVRLSDAKWLEIGSKVQLPRIETKRLVQARVLWLIGHQPAFDDPSIAHEEFLKSRFSGPSYPPSQDRAAALAPPVPLQAATATSNGLLPGTRLPADTSVKMEVKMELDEPTAPSSSASSNSTGAPPLDLKPSIPPNDRHIPAFSSNSTSIASKTPALPFQTTSTSSTPIVAPAPSTTTSASALNPRRPSRHAGVQVTSTPPNGIILEPTLAEAMSSLRNLGKGAEL